MARINQLILALSCLAIFIDGVEISEEMKKLTMELHSECVKETGVDEALIEQAKNGDFTDDRKLKCYLKCLIDKLKLITDAGDLDYDAMLNLVPESLKEAGTKVVRNCRGITGADLCEKAYNFYVCAHKTSPEDNFLA